MPHTVVGDPLRLRQVLMNLLNNAIKFTSKGEVVLRVGREEGLGIRGWGLDASARPRTSESGTLIPNPRSLIPSRAPESGTVIPNPRSPIPSNPQSLIPNPSSSATLNFSVSDTGIGIAAEKLESIFAPFTQADSSTSRRYGGTGLGLAISQRLANLMGGHIHVKASLARAARSLSP